MPRTPSKFRTVICEICGKEFEANHSQAKYCSIKCRRQGNRNSWNKYGKNNREKRRQASRYGYKIHREEKIAKTKAYQATEAGKRAMKKSYKNGKQKYPEKYYARQEVLKALRKGLLIKGPCEVKGCKIKKVEAHHDDYSKPLEVRWRCHRHHRELEGRLIK